MRMYRLGYRVYAVCRYLLRFTGFTRFLQRPLGRVMGQMVFNVSLNSRSPLLIHGHKMLLAKPRTYPAPDLLADHYEPGTTAFLERILKPGMGVVDVGAHVGYYTLLAARRVGPQGRVFAFEPEPTNHELLCKNSQLNEYRNIMAEQKAVGAQSGTARLYLSDLDSGSHSLYRAHGEHVEHGERFVDIGLVSLDAFLEQQGWPRIDLIKIDVEGAESDVLRGMQKVLGRFPNLRLVIEFCPSLLRRIGKDPRALLEALTNAGLTIALIHEEGGLVPFEEIDSSGLVQRLLRHPGYVNLFCGRTTDRTPSPKLRVLVSAFACCPPEARVFEGGEDLLGWKVIGQLGHFHEVWVITHPRKRGAIEAVRRHLLGDTVRFQYVRLPRWCEPWLRVRGLHQLYYYFWQIRAWLCAARLHRQVRFHVVHHVTYANDWMASFAGALLPIPYVRGPGGGAHRIPARFLSEFSLGGRLWEYVRVVGQWLFRRDPVFIIGQQRARAILVCNREAMAAVPARWRGKSQLFPVNGIDDEELCWVANTTERGNDRFNILFAGRLSRIKGTSIALKAFKEFSEKHGEAAFTIIGDGSDGKPLEQLITSLGLDERVRLLPWMPRQRFLDALRKCDVFLFPSLRDGGGAVVIEAMAAGKPVVCLDLGGPGLHVQEGCGVKIPAHRPSQAIREIATALEELWGDESLRERLGRAARARIESSYRWNHLGERLRDVYEEAVRCRVHGDSVR